MSIKLPAFINQPHTKFYREVRRREKVARQELRDAYKESGFTGTAEALERVIDVVRGHV